MVSLRGFGQACFEIKNSITIVTDPHDGESVGLSPPETKGEIVTISHQHFDHSSGRDLVSKEETEVAKTVGTRKVKGIRIDGIQSYHDKNQGGERGENIIFVFDQGDFRICHLGDLGHKLSSEKIRELGSINILLIPVGGNYTIDAREAIEIIEKIEPDIVIPMHYKLSGLEVDISTEKEFLRLAREKGWKVEEKEKAEIESLPKKRKIIKLECQSA
ncbi:hypothetical protein AKJ65_01700 [candidate division MSBL1 archaeon SCGC-AAA259E19]|uniref:Zn-dependent hydrolase n=1 Tax=candidate division MSBL1 archaeon SCGC-AAA259E19 TaxID=1698264 RepID=A0A133UMS8_9EURY|nr:hypothetical protein AKJ65_01700 [candidate division MSBL1 archaeon SCGC-AAA259E19]